MRRVLAIWATGLLAIVAAWQLVPARGQVMLLTGAGKGNIASAYSGPGDIATATVYLGLRAYSAADRGNRLINICDSAGANCIDWVSDASTGKLVAQTLVGPTDCTAVTTCRVKTVYDRAGTFCTGAVACDVTQATNTQRPTLNWNGGNPFLVHNSAALELLCTTVNLGANIAQTFTVSWVGLRASGTGFQETLAQTGSIVESGFSNSANNLLMFAGSVAVVSKTDNNWYATQSVYAGASSTFFVNGSGPTTVAAGANSFSSAQKLCIGGTTAGTNYLNGNWRESMIFGSGLSAGNQTSLGSQQQAFWGF